MEREEDNMEKGLIRNQLYRWVILSGAAITPIAIWYWVANATLVGQAYRMCMVSAIISSVLFLALAILSLESKTSTMLWGAAILSGVIVPGLLLIFGNERATASERTMAEPQASTPATVKRETPAVVDSTPPLSASVDWRELYKAEVKKNTLQADEQIRRQAQAQGGSLPYVVQEIGNAASLTFNPTHQTGVWYVGLPLVGLTGEDKDRRNFQGSITNTVSSARGTQPHFEVAGSPNDKWLNLHHDQLCNANPDRGDFGVFVRWKAGEKIPDETFTITSQYVLSEWPVSWQVRIKNLPRSDRNNRKAVPVTVVPTTVTGLPGKRIDSLVCITITGSNGQVIPVSGEVWFGSTSKLIDKPFDSLPTIGEDNPALAIEHFCAEPVNVDITFLPRTTSSL